jgi:hypothetical protein
MNLEQVTLVMVPREEWAAIKNTQQEILQQLIALQKSKQAGISVNYITAKEFMATVRIGRTKFDELVATNNIRIIKKGRKIYLQVREVERYFKSDIPN